MRIIFISFLFLSSLYASQFYNENKCSSNYEIKNINEIYNIYVYEDLSTYDEDLGLEANAKMLLFNYEKNQHIDKKLRGLKLSNFTKSKVWECDNKIHAIFLISRKNIKQVYKKNNESYNSYKSNRINIIKKIAYIESKDDLKLKDYELLYNLYFSIGKISDVDKIMDKIMDLKMEN